MGRYASVCKETSLSRNNQAFAEAFTDGIPEPPVAILTDKKQSGAARDHPAATAHCVAAIAPIVAPAKLRERELRIAGSPSSLRWSSATK
jgi:hypothetical protein